ncbi:type IV conjugative transfer system pilin TraA [Pantoea cypripedii]|jgi:type IV conjugative transfer system pilin TraA|uniref:Pilin n=1 Tax=Pantoea cypripedii TaxID=55209 RepID=A0A6B9G4E3_PANCY|nr:type IV conjugative transfer system pilin TraA [Pantoea cypripedii]QGY32541.1 TraA fimbrial protein precursor [Pantoea cypripedii]
MKSRILSSLKHCRKAGAVAWHTQYTMSVLLVFVLMIFTAQQVHAVDLFIGGKPMIKDTLGSDSTVVWILYVLEVIAGAWVYIKTKNLAMFGGIAAVMIYINVAFGIIP